ncbi:TetR family transcriptional regulator C-terminal domain-containing protein [Microbispora sp. NPDC049633]|uniref:TetR family transcriptional regulator C-terminal domain-containing protein n=1 Tax=Microbispora sp. NPDC049633 TaxID=3154355 RepID=UPI0034361BD2
MLAPLLPGERAPRPRAHGRDGFRGVDRQLLERAVLPVRSAIIEMLPLDDERRTEARIALAFLARSAVEPVYAATLREGYPYHAVFFAEQIRRAQQNGEAPADLVPEREAVILFAITQGLVNPTLIGHYTEETVVDAVDRHLDRIFPGTGRPGA